MEYKGVIEIPNLSDEYDANEIDMSVTLETKGPKEVEIRNVLLSVGLEVIFDAPILPCFSVAAF